MLPAPIAAAWAWFDGIKFIGKAIKTLWQRKLTVEVLDGVAIGAALLQKTTQQLECCYVPIGYWGYFGRMDSPINPY